MCQYVCSDIGVWSHRTPDYESPLTPRSYEVQLRRWMEGEEGEKEEGEGGRREVGEEWDGSLRRGLELLRARIRTARLAPVIPSLLSIPPDLPPRWTTHDGIVLYIAI